MQASTVATTSESGTPAHQPQTKSELPLEEDEGNVQLPSSEGEAKSFVTSNIPLSQEPLRYFIPSPGSPLYVTAPGYQGQYFGSSRPPNYSSAWDTNAFGKPQEAIPPTTGYTYVQQSEDPTSFYCFQSGETGAVSYQQQPFNLSPYCFGPETYSYSPSTPGYSYTPYQPGSEPAAPAVDGAPENDLAGGPPPPPGASFFYAPYDGMPQYWTPPVVPAVYLPSGIPDQRLSHSQCGGGMVHPQGGRSALSFSERGVTGRTEYYPSQGDPSPSVMGLGGSVMGYKKKRNPFCC